MSETLSINFSAMAPTLSKQLKAQGLELEKTTVSKYQSLAHSITMLSIHGFLSKKQSDTFRKKLFNQIRTSIK